MKIKGVIGVPRGARVRLTYIICTSRFSHEKSVLVIIKNTKVLLK